MHEVRLLMIKSLSVYGLCKYVINVMVSSSCSIIIENFNIER